MENLDNLTKNSSSKEGFFKHVFNFDADSKSELLNIVQYAIIAVIPVIILNKATQRFIPEADDEKNSLELLAEIIIQLLTMFLGIFFINRFITYFPTYSGEKYPEFNVTTIVLAVLVIVLSLQTKLGEKVSILVDRLMELWDGTNSSNDKNKKGGKDGKVKVSQPISQGTMAQSAMNQSMMAGTTSISQLPSYASGNQMPPSMPPQMPDYNNMYQNDQGSPSTSDYGTFGGLMAANEALGGSFGSSF
uniref:Uncharacterized protein n=1 Tax=viral metagenome TaxID=1070528 RepID=A0A6C0F4C5_9ZZZZ